MFQQSQAGPAGRPPKKSPHSLKDISRPHKRRTSWSFLLLLGACACGQPIGAPAKLDFSDLDRTDSLTGIDADANGIRDDIDAYITREYPDPAQRSAVQQDARAMQKALLVPPGDVSAAKTVVREAARATNCIYAEFPKGGWKEAARVGKEVEALTTNTKKRLLAYLQMNKSLDGTSWAMPEGETCE